jgi:hypothetical protein
MKRMLQWSAPPAALAFSLPHVLAMLPSSIEASVQPATLLECRQMHCPRYSACFALSCLTRHVLPQSGAPGLLTLPVDGLQVRSLRAVSDYKLLQTLPAPAHTVVSTSQGSDGSVFAASGVEVWQLRPTPLLDQVCRPLICRSEPEMMAHTSGRLAAGDSSSVKSPQRSFAPLHDRLRSWLGKRDTRRPWTCAHCVQTTCRCSTARRT